MKFFLDTANLDELKKSSAWGIVDGVTTNPSLIAKEGRPIAEQIRAICGIVDGDISAEVVSTDASGMIREGRELARIPKNVVIKCPLIREGIKATSILSGEVKTLDMLFDHPLTDAGLAQFLKDYNQAFEPVPA